MRNAKVHVATVLLITVLTLRYNSEVFPASVSSQEMQGKVTKEPESSRRPRSLTPKPRIPLRTHVGFFETYQWSRCFVDNRTDSSSRPSKGLCLVGTGPT